MKNMCRTIACILSFVLCITSIPNQVLSTIGIAAYEPTQDQVKLDDASTKVVNETEESQETEAEIDIETLIERAASTTTGGFAGECIVDRERMFLDPFQVEENISEKISHTDGSLRYTVTDYVLPGKNGLDLVIQRTYDSNKASNERPSGYFRWCVDRYVSNPNFIYAYMTVYRKDTDLNMAADGSIASLGRVTYRSDLGMQAETGSIDHWSSRIFQGTLEQITGMSLRFPYDSRYMQLDLYQVAWKNGIPHKNATQIANGWNFNFSYISDNTLYLSDGREIRLNGGLHNNLGNHFMEDLKLTYGAEYIVESTNSYYNLHYKDGKKEHFDSSGRLIAIVDRYNNAIKFQYDKQMNGDIWITDSLNRTTIIYTAGGPAFVQLPNKRMLLYYNNGSELTKVTDTENRDTIYTYETQERHFDMGYYLRLNTAVEPFKLHPYVIEPSTTYTMLKKVQYSTGKVTNYVYETAREDFSVYGRRDEIRVKERYESQGTQKYNHKQYSFGTGMMGIDGSKLKWLDETDVIRNIRNRYEFWVTSNVGAISGYINRIETYQGNTLKRTVHNWQYNHNPYQDAQFPVPELIYTEYHGTTTRTVYETYDYDCYGNLIASWTPLAGVNIDKTNLEYKTTYTYSQPYNLLTGKTYKRDSQNTIKEAYTLTNDRKDIAQATISENNVLKQKETYTYDDYGNIKEVKKYIQPNGSTYVHTKYDYKDNAYLQKEMVLNVNDSSGLNTGTVSVERDYDRFGRVIQEKDGNGYVYDYVYDSIGRLLEANNPEQSPIRTKKTFAYDDQNRTVTEANEVGFTLVHQYNQHGKIASIKDQTGVVKESAERKHPKVGNSNAAMDRVSSRKTAGGHPAGLEV